MSAESSQLPNYVPEFVPRLKLLAPCLATDSAISSRLTNLHFFVLCRPTAIIGKLSVETAASASIAVGSNSFGNGVSSKPVVNALGIKSPKKRPTRSRRDR